MDKAQNLIQLLKIAKLETLEECLEMTDYLPSKLDPVSREEIFEKIDKFTQSLQQKILQIKGEEK